MPPTPNTIISEVYLRIYPKLASKIRQFGIPESQVEDLLQETFRSAYEGLLSQRFESRSALDTWVISIGKNLCLKHHRAQRALKRKALDVPIGDQSDDASAPEVSLRSDTPAPDRQAEDRERLTRVVRLIQGLPDILREPLVLKARGHSYRQIARLLAIPPELVSSRIHQARAELQRKLPDVQPPYPR